MTLETAARLARGVELEDGMTAPGRVRILSRARGQTQIELTIHEGRNREVKRMCSHVGHPVKQLKRIAFAGIPLGTLRAGEWRELATEEVEALRNSVKLAPDEKSGPGRSDAG
jgi:23S rRNA pseudouridine2605 synthase